MWYRSYSLQLAWHIPLYNRTPTHSVFEVTFDFQDKIPQDEVPNLLRDCVNGAGYSKVAPLVRLYNLNIDIFAALLSDRSIDHKTEVEYTIQSLYCLNSEVS